MTRLPIPSELQDLIEGAIDRHGLANVIDAIAEICAAKADHIRANWQDGLTAAPWTEMAGMLRELETQAARRKL